MKKQVLVIHGGETFENYEDYLVFLGSWRIESEDLHAQRIDWKDNLAKDLGENFEVILPKMPNKLNAKYLEWKIWFEKFIPLLDPEVILIGHSLGGIFLAKYLSENKFPKKILATILISAPHDDIGSQYSLADFKLPENLNLLAEQGGKIFLYHSQDDWVVPFSDFQKFQKDISGAVCKIFTDRGHFNQEKFPELVEAIKTI